MRDDSDLQMATESGEALVAFYESRVRDLYVRNREIAGSITWSHVDFATHKKIMKYYDSLMDLDEARWRLEEAKREAHGPV